MRRGAVIAMARARAVLACALLSWLASLGARADPSDPSTRVVADAPSNAAHARRVSAFAGPAPRRPRPGRAIARALRDVRDAPALDDARDALDDALDDARDALAAARAFGEAVEDALDVVVSNVAEELLWMSDDSDASTFASTWSPDPAASSHHVPHSAPPAPPAPPPPRPPAYDFARKGPHRVATREVEFFWPRLGLDLARRITPRVPAVVRVPSALPGRPGPFPVVAFGIGWNSWTERYAKTLTHLASHGVVVIAPKVADQKIVGAFSALSANLRACLEWSVRETNRRGSPLYGRVDVARMGLFGHSSGAGAAARAAVDAQILPGTSGGGSSEWSSDEWGRSTPASSNAFNAEASFDGSASSPASRSSAARSSAHVVREGLRALMGLGAFAPSSGREPEALASLRGVAVVQLAGQRDSHVTPRSVAQIADGMRRTAPRAVAVLRHGTHCFLDEASEYAYPPSQCDAANDPTRWHLPNADVVPNATRELYSPPRGPRLLSPAAQLRVAREYLAAFFVGELGRGKAAMEGRRRVWGASLGGYRARDDEEGGPGGRDSASSYRSRRRRDERAVTEPSDEEGDGGGSSAFADWTHRLEPDASIATDPRMSRVEVVTRA